MLTFIGFVNIEEQFNDFFEKFEEKKNKDQSIGKTECPDEDAKTTISTGNIEYF